MNKFKNNNGHKFGKHENPNKVLKKVINENKKTELCNKCNHEHEHHEHHEHQEHQENTENNENSE